jgi:hypothetical protein
MVIGFSTVGRKKSIIMIALPVLDQHTTVLAEWFLLPWRRGVAFPSNWKF